MFGRSAMKVELQPRGVGFPNHPSTRLKVQIESLCDNACLEP